MYCRSDLRVVRIGASGTVRVDAGDVDTASASGPLSDTASATVAETLAGADAAVLDAEAPAAVAATVARSGVPTVVRTDDPEEWGWAAATVAPDDPESRVDDLARRAVERADGDGETGRLARLHDGTAELVKAADPDDLYRRVVDIAERLLDFDKSVVVVDEGGRFVERASSPQDVTDPPVSVPTGRGVVGRVHRTGEAELVADAGATDGAISEGHDYRSAVVVPMGEDAVFEALSARPGAYGEADRELAELLCSYAGETLSRIGTEAALRAHRDQFEALFENVPDPAVFYELVDDDPHARRVNAAFERVFGFDADEVAGESIDEFIVPEAGVGTATDLNARLARGENVSASVERLTADGTRDFLLQVVPLELGAENYGGFAIYTDVTEQRERERELRERNERLDEFASVVSHDLRNPISVAEGYLDLYRETGEESHLERVESSLLRMGDLVEDLLTLAREGRDVGDLETVSLGSIATDAWAGVNTRDAALTVEEDVTVDADADRIRELFENLFRNAVEHGGDDVAVTVSGFTYRDGSDGVDGFYVADDGPGFDGEDLFESGVTSVEGGTGLGLAIVRRVAEAHGWSVRAVEGEHGARFEFEF